MKKNIYLAIFALLAIGIGFFFLMDIKRIETEETKMADETTKEENLIGGERDEHGCLGPAGYSYDEGIKACIRNWELDDNQRLAATKAVKTILGEDTGLTIIEVTGSGDEMYFVKIQKPNTEQITVKVEDLITIDESGDDIEEIETDDTNDITDEIAVALAEKNEWDDTKLEVSVSENDNVFASGTVSFVDSVTGGGGWYAANTDEGWKIIWDGNGSIFCSDLEEFETDYSLEIPTSLIVECYDNDLGIVETR